MFLIAGNTGTQKEAFSSVMFHVPGYNNGRILEQKSRRQAYDCDTKQKNVTIELRWEYRFIERDRRWNRRDLEVSLMLGYLTSKSAKRIRLNCDGCTDYTLNWLHIRRNMI